ncbi:hypothetical protein, partial [Pantoea sp. A4]|uniref:hypothetical protein n=1 Tax=Pantoea sp. A4 TaxID=1225184 RepID=UPI001ED9B9DC
NATDFGGQGNRSEPRRSPIALTGRGISISQATVLTLTFTFTNHKSKKNPHPRRRADLSITGKS